MTATSNILTRWGSHTYRRFAMVGASGRMTKRAVTFGRRPPRMNAPRTPRAAERGHDIDLAAEAGDVVGARQHPAAWRSCRTSRAWRSPPWATCRAHAVAVLVDDRLADHQGAKIANRRQARQHVGEGVPGPEPVEKAPRVFRADARGGWSARDRAGRGAHRGRRRRAEILRARARRPASPSAPAPTSCCASRAVDEKTASCVKRTRPPTSCTASISAWRRAGGRGRSSNSCPLT